MCVFYFASTAHIRDYARKESVYHLSEVGDRFDAMLEDYENCIRELAANGDVLRLLERREPSDVYKVNTDLYDAKNSLGKNVMIHILSAGDAYGISTDRIPRSYYYPYNENFGLFRKIRESPSPVLHTGLHALNLAENVSFSVGEEVRDSGGRIAGYVVMDVLRSNITQLTSAYWNLYHINIVIADGHNNVMYHSKGSDMEGLGKFREIGDYGEIAQRGQEEGVLSGGYVYRLSEKSGYLLAGEVSEDVLEANISFFKSAAAIAVICILILGALFAFLVSKSISRPVKLLSDSMKRLEQGDLTVRVEVRGEDEISGLGSSFNAMAQQIETLIHNVEEKQKSLRIAEINELQLQVTPHFLYNTLDLIKWYAKLGDTKAAADITVQIGKLLRRILNVEEDIISVRDEMELVKCYADIQKRRYDGRLLVEYDIAEEILYCRIPKLLIQPVVENAVIHGFEDKLDCCRLRITGKRQGDYLIFQVTDNGKGIGAETLCQIREGNREGMYKIGLNNVHRRTKLYGDAHCGLEIDSEVGQGTRITLTVRTQRG